MKLSPPTFCGSGEVRYIVGRLVNDCMQISGTDVNELIKKKFEEAIEELRYYVS